MSLTRKHPLRLLLPPAMRSSPSENCIIHESDIEIETQVAEHPRMEYRQGAIIPEDGVFDVFGPNGHKRSTSRSLQPSGYRPSVSNSSLVEDADAPYTDISPAPLPFSRSPSGPGCCPSILTKFSLENSNAAYIDDSSGHFSLHPPFSTPGPGLSSLLGSSADSTTAFSRFVPSPKTNSSPTYYSDSNSRSLDPHVLDSSSDSGHFADILEPNADCTNDSESDPLPPDIVSNPLFSGIYATPGPRYCLSRPVYFGSPTEDPLVSGEQSDFGPYDDIDFQWKPFDRKQLVVPAISKRMSFACPTDETPNSAFRIHQDVNILSTRPKTSERSMLPKQSLSVPPVSPSPFRFSPPPEAFGDQKGVPEPQEASQRSTILTAANPAFAPVPGIYISPLGCQAPLPSPRSSLTRERNYDIASTLPSEHTFGGTVTLTDFLMNSAMDAQNDRYEHSQVSNDSIESWD
ncbi:hypothetical protein GALMADRAFT_515931 [Galerina marginata CBS 339.88]|uniref:Uncharacterized protein n=1 Tax=Galerina marginata (strain CBS 339.88) TaxID=685588 RepID=A0A067TAC3_GALM3|nr:hypothetical protein GALMADRAFT_515931 [Galerina marginata CBS 339.88]